MWASQPCRETFTWPWTGLGWALQDFLTLVYSTLPRPPTFLSVFNKSSSQCMSSNILAISEWVLGSKALWVWGRARRTFTSDKLSGAVVTTAPTPTPG